MICMQCVAGVLRISRAAATKDTHCLWVLTWFAQERVACLYMQESTGATLTQAVQNV